MPLTNPAFFIYSPVGTRIVYGRIVRSSKSLTLGKSRYRKLKNSQAGARDFVRGEANSSTNPLPVPRRACNLTAILLHPASR